MRFVDQFINNQRSKINIPESDQPEEPLRQIPNMCIPNDSLGYRINAKKCIFTRGMKPVESQDSSTNQPQVPKGDKKGNALVLLPCCEAGKPVSISKVNTVLLFLLHRPVGHPFDNPTTNQAQLQSFISVSIWRPTRSLIASSIEHPRIPESKPTGVDSRPQVIPYQINNI